MNTLIKPLGALYQALQSMPDSTGQKANSKMKSLRKTKENQHFQYPQGESNPCPLAENQIS